MHATLADAIRTYATSPQRPADGPLRDAMHLVARDARQIGMLPEHMVIALHTSFDEQLVGAGIRIDSRVREVYDRYLPECLTTYFATPLPAPGSVAGEIADHV